MAAKDPSPGPIASAVEYQCLVSISDKLISSIAIDPAPVAQKLFAKGVISSSALSSTNKDKNSQASEIVQQVLASVKVFPQNFKVFLSVIEELPWLKNLMKLINEAKVSVQLPGNSIVQICH